MSVLLVRATFFIYSPIIIGTIMRLAQEYKKLLEENSSYPVLSNPTVKNYVLMGAGPQI